MSLMDAAGFRTQQVRYQLINLFIPNFIPAGLLFKITLYYHTGGTILPLYRLWGCSTVTVLSTCFTESMLTSEAGEAPRCRSPVTFELNH